MSQENLGEIELDREPPIKTWLEFVRYQKFNGWIAKLKKREMSAIFVFRYHPRNFGGWAQTSSHFHKQITQQCPPYTSLCAHGTIGIP